MINRQRNERARGQPAPSPGNRLHRWSVAACGHV